MARTRRSPDGMFATGGAVTQDGKLPIYICNTCDSEVVWATSNRTGRKYLANIYRGQAGQRFYVKHQPHKCEEVLARREQMRQQYEEAIRANAETPAAKCGRTVVSATVLLDMGLDCPAPKGRR